MRYFGGFAGLLAALLTLPLSARAQAEGFSEDEVTKVALVSSSSRAFSTEYSLIYTEYAEEVKDMDRRVHNAKIGLGVSAVPIVIGAVLALAAAGSLGARKLRCGVLSFRRAKTRRHDVRRGCV